MLCHVVRSIDAFTRAESSQYDAEGNALLAWASQSVRAHELRSQSRLLRGDPLEELLRTTIDAAVDLAIIGTHGRTGFARFYVGSVAEGFLRRASIPVLVVRAPATVEVEREP